MIRLIDLMMALLKAAGQAIIYLSYRDYRKAEYFGETYIYVHG